MCCTRLAGNTGRKNDAKHRHLRTIAQLCRAISSQLRHVSTIGKKLLSSNISPTFRYNMLNFGPLAAEIVSLVWGTPANFNGFRVLAALLRSQTAALNRGHHLYSAGRPSRWALAQIYSFFFFSRLISAVGNWMSTMRPYTWCDLSANLECRFEMCCMWLAVNAGPKKVAKNRHLGTIGQLCRAISSQLRHVSTIGKNLLNINISSTCPYNMVNFGPLAAEIFWRVWGRY